MLMQHSPLVPPCGKKFSQIFTKLLLLGLARGQAPLRISPGAEEWMPQLARPGVAPAPALTVKGAEVGVTQGRERCWALRTIACPHTFSLPPTLCM